MVPIFPFTPHGPPPWAVVGIIIALVIGVPVLVGAVLGYLSESVRGRPPGEGVSF